MNWIWRGWAESLLIVPSGTGSHDEGYSTVSC